MLFVFRLALSRGRKGYTTVTAELWDQCRRLGVALPQPEPVAISSIAKARARVHEDVFRELHREILAHDTRGPDWNGRGPSPSTAPRSPAAAARRGRIPAPGRRRPLSAGPAVLSLPPRQPHAGRLHPHVRDVVVFDRGYFSFVLLRDMTARGLHPVFRIQRNSAAGFDRFRDGDRDDALVRITPGKNALRRLKAAGIPEPASPIVLRLVRYDIGEPLCARHDPRRYGAIQPGPLGTLSRALVAIEELFKISKTTLAVEEFHGRSERGVRQELYAHFNLIAMARLFTNRGDAALDEAHGDLEDADELHKRAGHAGRQSRGADPDADVGAGRRRSRVATSVLAARARLRRDGHSRAGPKNPSESGSGDDTRPRDLKPNLAGKGAKPLRKWRAPLRK